MDQVAIVIPRPEVLENANFTAKVYFRDQASNAADHPDTVHFRIDDLTNCRVVQDWAAVDIGATDTSCDIALASSYNALYNSHSPVQRMQLTVAGNKDGTFAASSQVQWWVKNRNLMPP